MSFIPPSPAVRTFLEQCLPDGAAAFTDKMVLLGEFLYETNEQVNLTAIPPEKFWNLHVADSLSPVRYFPDLFRRGTVLLDLGCGAGFPSLVLAAAFPEVSLTSVDSTLKKINFVQSAAEKLALGNLKAVHGRGNELARKPPFKGRYDAVFARAVASADILIREGLAFLKTGSSLIVYRTREQYESELGFLKKWKKGSFRSTELFELPDRTGTRMFLQISPCSQPGSKN